MRRRLLIILICAFISIGATSSRNFNGSTDKVVMSSGVTMDDNDTLLMWWNCDTATCAGTAMLTGNNSGEDDFINVIDNGDNTAYQLAVNGQVIFLSFQNGGGNWEVSINTWYCVGLTKNSSNLWTLWVDGDAQLDTETHANTLTINAIGNGYNAGNFAWDGEIAYYAFFDNRLLSGEEQLDFCRNPREGLPNLIRYYPLWEGAVDLTGNSSGTVTGTSSTSDGPPVGLTGGSV